VHELILLADQILASAAVALLTILSTEFVQKGARADKTFRCEIFAHGKKVFLNQALHPASMALLTILSTDYVQKWTVPTPWKNAVAHLLCLRIIRFAIKGLGYKSHHSPQYCPQNMCRTWGGWH
jgi:hypothetical protein